MIVFLVRDNFICSYVSIFVLKYLYSLFFIMIGIMNRVFYMTYVVGDIFKEVLSVRVGEL